MSRPSKTEKAKRRARRGSNTVELPPAVLAKMLEAASLILLAEVVRNAIRLKKTLVITFNDDGPKGKLVTENPYPDGDEGPPTSIPKATE